MPDFYRARASQKAREGLIELYKLAASEAAKVESLLNFKVFFVFNGWRETK